MQSGRDLEPEHRRERSQTCERHVRELVRLQSMHLGLRPTCVDRYGSLTQARDLASRPQLVDEPSQHIVAASSATLLSGLPRGHAANPVECSFAAAYPAIASEFAFTA
jgi:hypothetical protein